MSWSDDVRAMIDEDFQIFDDYFQFSKREKENLMSAEDVKFNEFKTDVDKLLVGMVGLSSDDLPDATWYDYFDAELSPIDAILCAVDDYWYDEQDLQDLIIAQVERGKI